MSPFLETFRTEQKDAAKRAHGAENVVQVELDGPGVSPANVDAVAFLRVTESYLWLVKLLGEINDAPVTLTGLEVIDKCAAVQTWPTDMTRAVLFCRKATAVIAEQEDAPHRAVRAASSAREALRLLPRTQTVRVFAGNYAGALLAPPQPESRELPWEQVELRATLIRSGGEKPVAQFRSADDGALFSLDLGSVEKARELGQQLYREVDVEALIMRDVDGGIERGELLEIHVLSEEEPVNAWRSWFKENASEWSDTEDVLGELGRNDD